MLCVFTTIGPFLRASISSLVQRSQWRSMTVGRTGLALRADSSTRVYYRRLVRKVFHGNLVQDVFVVKLSACTCLGYRSVGILLWRHFRRLNVTRLRGLGVHVHIIGGVPLEKVVHYFQVGSQYFFVRICRAQRWSQFQAQTRIESVCKRAFLAEVKHPDPCIFAASVWIACQAKAE